MKGLRWRLFSIVLVSLIVFALVVGSGSVPQYGFLRGLEPSYRLGPNEMRKSGFKGHFETVYYTFRADYHSVLVKVERELLPEAFSKEVYEDEQTVRYVKKTGSGADRVVRSVVVADRMLMPPDRWYEDGTGWVTIIVFGPADRTPFDRFKRWLGLGW